MRQSLKVLWVVLSSLFLDFNISGRSDKMAPDAMEVHCMFASDERQQQKLVR